MKTKNHHLNIALLGCGRISGKHLSAINDLSSEGVKLTSVSDKNKFRLDACHVESDVKKLNDFCDAEFLSNADLAVILTESGNHFYHAKSSIERGVDVLIEKPATLRLDHAYELRALAEKHNRKIYVVKQNRYNKPIRQAKQFMDSSFLGKPQIGSVRVRWCRHQSYYDMDNWRGTWLMDGGVISNQASHHIDLLRWFMGPVHSVTAVERRFSAEIETEDTIVALIEFESGAVATLEATTSTRPANLEGSLSIQGDLGAFEVAGFAVNALRYMHSGHKDFNETLYDFQLQSNTDTSDVYGSSHREVYRSILADRLGHMSEVVKIDEAIQSLELIHLIYMSVEQNKRIYMSDLASGSNRLGLI